jgi:hypothetical protein
MTIMNQVCYLIVPDDINEPGFCYLVVPDIRDNKITETWKHISRPLLSTGTTTTTKNRYQ